jgi:hypothetical protein
MQTSPTTKMRTVGGLDGRIQETQIEILTTQKRIK